jgi:hypothetical protein
MTTLPRITGRGGALAAAACGAALLAGAAPADARPLSEPGKLSRWAFVEYASVARARPSAHARPVGRLRVRTEDRTDELTLALEQRGGWVRVRLPQRPNGRTGWVRRWTLGAWHTTGDWLKVDKRRLRLTLLRDGKAIFSAPIGIGGRGTATPSGQFYVRDRLVLKSATGAYGPLAFGTSAHSPTLTDWPRGGVIGIHGTNEPGRVPGHPSHGCIRVRNDDIVALGKLLAVGTPVTIR